MKQKSAKLDYNRLSKVVGALVYLSNIVFLVIFGVMLSISVNVYLHELGHYLVADFYELNPSMHITNVLSLQDESLRVNMNPVAYVQYQNPGDSPEGIRKNIAVTLAGPLANLFITILVFVSYILTKYILREKLYSSDIYKRSQKYRMKVFRLSFLIDVIFISLLIPSLVSVIVNLSNTPGSDGAFLRQLIRKL